MEFFLNVSGEGWELEPYSNAKIPCPSHPVLMGSRALVIWDFLHCGVGVTGTVVYSPSAGLLDAL
jgi:hypothetical protein